jgi:hypothetical protein
MLQLVLRHKQRSTFFLEDGDVNISDKAITINCNSYTKRAKIYKDSRWVDTHPNIITRSYHKFRQVYIYKNYFDKNLVVYSPKVVNITNKKDRDTKLIIYSMVINRFRQFILWMSITIKEDIKSMGSLWIYLLFIILIVLYYISNIFIEEEKVDLNST